MRSASSCDMPPPPPRNLRRKKSQKTRVKTKEISLCASPAESTSAASSWKALKALRRRVVVLFSFFRVRKNLIGLANRSKLFRSSVAVLVLVFVGVLCGMR